MSCDLTIASWISVLKYLNNEPTSEENIINVRVATQLAIKHPIWFHIININDVTYLMRQPFMILETLKHKSVEFESIKNIVINEANSTISSINLEIDFIKSMNLEKRNKYVQFINIDCADSNLVDSIMSHNIFNESFDNIYNSLNRKFDVFVDLVVMHGW